MLRRDAVDEFDVGGELAFGLVHVVEGRAGKLELPARLQRHRPAGLFVEQADERALVLDGLPPGQFAHALEDRADAAAPPAPLVGHGREVIDVEGEFLVLGAQLEDGIALAALFEPADEFVARGNRCRIGDVARHGPSGL